MKQTALLIVLLLAQTLPGQEFIPLWSEGEMPDSRGMRITDSVANERYFRVGTPGVFAYFPSQDENCGAAVLICPAGGYHHETYVKGGVQFAKWLNTLGICAFVLKYRLPNSPDLLQRENGPLEDARRAIQLIRQRASEWRIRPDRIGACGTSAGGHLAASLGTIHDCDSAMRKSDGVSSVPNFLILVSPVITMGPFTHAGSRDNLLGPVPTEHLVHTFSCELHVSPVTPPTFIVHAFNDNTVPVENSLAFARACVENHVPVSIHIFPHGAHAIALRGNPGSTELWTALCETWLRESGFLPGAKGPDH